MPGIEIITAAAESGMTTMQLLGLVSAAMGLALLVGGIAEGEEGGAFCGALLIGIAIFCFLAPGSEEKEKADAAAAATITAIEEHYDVELISELDLTDRKPQTVTVRDSDGQTFNLSATITDERAALFTVAGAGLEYDGQDPTTEATSSDTEAKP